MCVSIETDRACQTRESVSGKTNDGSPAAEVCQVIGGVKRSRDEAREAAWNPFSSFCKRLIEDKLRYLARSDLGETEKQGEIKKTEKVFGALAPIASDVFRACAKSLVPHISPWDLAAVTVHRLHAAGAEPHEIMFAYSIAVAWVGAYRFHSLRCASLCLHCLGLRLLALPCLAFPIEVECRDARVRERACTRSRARTHTRTRTRARSRARTRTRARARARARLRAKRIPVQMLTLTYIYIYI